MWVVKRICKCTKSLVSYWWLSSFWLEIPGSHCVIAPPTDSSEERCFTLSIGADQMDVEVS